MKIAVIVRLVPDLNEEIEVGPDGKDIDREWIGSKLNEFDDQALEEAVLLKERANAKVVVMALEADGVDRLLQTAIARGADEAVRVSSESSGIPDATAAARRLKKAVEEVGADLVLTGVQTPEDVFGQLAPALAGALGWPTINAVSRVAVADGAVQATQEYSGGHAATFQLRGPAVLGIQAASQPPRYVSGTKLRAASTTPIRALVVTDGASSRRIDALRPPDRGQEAIMIEGDAEAVAERLLVVLSERGVLGA
jgi:electron transfer flavoprotein beta subunit